MGNIIVFSVCKFLRCISEDGRLCAAAFVQNRKSYTGCTDAPTPTGKSGRPWCYVEAQVGCDLILSTCWLLVLFCDKLLDANVADAAWDFCAQVVDYDALRKEASALFEDKANEVQGLVKRLQKTQSAAENVLDTHAPLIFLVMSTAT